MKPAWQPSAQQELLLEACLAGGDRAAIARRAWVGTVDLQNLEAGSQRLLPLLAARSSPRDVEAGTWALIQGAYRKTWYHNQLLLAAARDLAALLGNAGIPVMLLKGAPLALTNYRDVGARPMGDLDLAVPVAFARKAVERMLGHGWTPEATPLTATMTPGRRHDAGWIPGLRTLAGFDERYFNVRHAHGFRRANGLGIDLHWHVFQGDCDPESDDDTWRHAGVVTHGGCSFQIPAPEEHLLLILAHAARWSPTSSIRWVADAGTLLQANPGLDWARFLIVAAQRRQTGAAGELLTYLAHRFPIAVPAEVRQALAAHPVTRQTRSSDRRSRARPTPLTGVTELLYLHARYRTLRRRFPAACPPGFPGFVCAILGAEHPRQVLSYAWREGLRRLRGIR
jgi:hypothetical protein